MAGNDNSLVTPKGGLGILKIPAGSPLAIQGVFLEIIRERFSEDSGLEWIWSPNPNETGILIEASYGTEEEVRNFSPSIYVQRTQTVPGGVMIGDRVGVNLPDHKEGFGAIVTTSLNIDCVSNDEGESAVLGDIIQYMLLASSDIIQREFGFYNLSKPVLEGTQPFEQDQSKFNTPVALQAQFWIRWSQVPIRPLLQQLAQRVQSSGKDATEHFSQITVDSLSSKK